MDTRPAIGIISHERVASSMAGPAIRCWEFARALAADADVKLCTPSESDLVSDGFEIRTYSRENNDSLTAAVGDCDILLAQGFTFNENLQLTRMGKRLVVDLYVPMTLEAMGQYEHLTTAEQSGIQQGIIDALRRQMDVGHFFICASERQRDYWLGWLSLAGRITPELYSVERTLRQLIDVVPFGLPDSPPAATNRVLKGIHPAIRETDKVLLWGGGIYNWLDPLTPVRAVARLTEKRDDIKLFFLGARHPNPDVPKMRVYDEAVTLSRELGVLDSSVIFNDKWVSYEDRANFLLEADIGVNANVDHIETRFSFRTRILDCIWASLPIVSTHGDSLSRLAELEKFGLVTPSGDVAAYAASIERLVDDGELYHSYQENIRRAALGFRWSEVTMPLKRFLSRSAASGEVDPSISKLDVSLPGDVEAGCETTPAGGPRGVYQKLRHTAGRAKKRIL